LNGLRVSEATAADIEHLGLERGHRTLVITRKGGKVVTIPLAPRTARAIDPMGSVAAGRGHAPRTPVHSVTVGSDREPPLGAPVWV
jgi:integrase